MKKAFSLIISLFFALGWASAQEVYFSGNNDGIGKVWKNNTLIYSISDSIPVSLSTMQVAPDGSIFTAGHVNDTAFELVQGRVWRNDSLVFSAGDSTAITKMVVDGNGWTAAGIGENAWEEVTGLVWQNGTLLYAFSDSTATYQIIALAVDTVTGDIYTGGILSAPDAHACVWKNDTVFWQSDTLSGINALCFADGNLYAAGFVYAGEETHATLWQNDSLIFSIVAPDAEFTAVTYYNGSVYFGGYEGNTLYIWQDDEVLFDHPCASFSAINALIVNEFGVYYAGQIDSVATVWKDGETLYQPDDCESINGLAVLPTPPPPTFTLTVEADSTGWGIVTGGGVFHYGDTATIAAIPNTGCEFLFWNDSITDNPRDIIITQDSTFTAYFGRIQYTLTVESNNPEWGNVSGGGSYHLGDTVQIEAFPNTGHVFISWDDDNTDNPRSVIVESDTTFIAVFKPLQFEITTECDPVEGGTVTGAGIYDYGTTATLTATPNEYYSFICWSDGIASNPRHVNVTGNANYKALFYFNGLPQYTITVTANDPTLGSVAGGGTYPQGMTIEISAMPNDNATFEGWSDGITDNPRSITVTEDLELMAIFAEIEFFTITVRPENVLLGTTYGSGSYPLNQVVSIGATPHQGYYFSGWQDGDMNNPRSIIVTGNAEYIASFAQTPIETYNITVLFDENQGFILGAGTYIAGSTATIAAIPADGFMFVKWSDETTDNPKEILVEHDVELTAFFNAAGVDENGFETFCLYPNPANDKLHIEGWEGQREVLIYNSFGVLVRTMTIDGDAEIDINGLTSGLYYLRIGRHAVRFVKM